MATRALVGYLNPETKELTSTYNHYDGYPSNLGKALDDHYSDDSKAYGIANYGYISYVDPETGEIEAKHKEDADVEVLPNNFEDAMMNIASLADSYGADFVYIYNPETKEWVIVKMYGKAQTAETLGKFLSSLESNFGSNVEESYNAKWKNFINGKNN
jgi:hypothetical protein